MSLALRNIRRAIVATIKAADTACGTRVYSNRFRAVAQGKLPACLVFALDEEWEVETESPREYLRKPRIAIVLFVLARPPSAGSPPREITADEVLDEEAQKIEDALIFDQKLLGTAADSWLREWRVEPIDDGEVQMAAGRLVLEVQYRTEAGERGDPSELHDLTRARALFHLNESPDGRVDAVDEFPLPQPGAGG